MSMHQTNTKAGEGLPSGLITLFAAGAGLAVATLYYNQPMLAQIGQTLQASPGALELVPTLTQLGYALGILLLAPLGDRHDRRQIILAKGAALVAVLLVAAMAPSILVLNVASLAIGIFATLAQDIVPAAATLADDSRRGRVVGQVMTGLLLGILLSRVVSGVVAAQWGWRVMFLGAALSMAVLTWVSARAMPHFKSTTHLPYTALLGSLWQLWRRHPALRHAAVAQGLLMMAFGAFWSTLALFLQAEPFHLGSAALGAFGLAGAAGALAAPLAGKLADSGGPGRVARLGAALACVSFALLLVLPWTNATVYLAVLALSAVGFDFGLQGALIAHQTLIYSIDAQARSRLNAVLFVAMFLSMAVGSFLGSRLLTAGGWLAVVVLMTGAALMALMVRLGADRAGR